MLRVTVASAALAFAFTLGTMNPVHAEGEPEAAPVSAEAVVPAESEAPAVAIPSASADVPPASDSGWVARFFWSPQYCDSNRGSREPQCVPVQGFVLRDLIRVRDGKRVEGCTSGPISLSPEILGQMLQFTRNLPETRASWQIYGRCSGLSEVDYAAYTELVDRRIWWPQEFSPEGPDVESSAAEILALVAKGNHKLPVESLSTHCKRSALESIDVRFDDNFNYVQSGIPADGNCKRRIRVRGRR